MANTKKSMWFLCLPNMASRCCCVVGGCQSVDMWLLAFALFNKPGQVHARTTSVFECFNYFIESVFTFCITCWFGNVTVEQKSLFRKGLSIASIWDPSMRCRTNLSSQMP